MTQYAGVVPIEIQCGREGLWGIRNKNMIPIGGAIQLRNATLEDHTWRSGGGAQKLGVVVPGGATTLLEAGIDYWPTPVLQRNVVAGSDGTINKDDGTGNGWVQVKTALSTAFPYNPYFLLGGAEATGRNRKCFYCDGRNIVQVLSGDGVVTTDISNPPADWSGTNQPSGLVAHQGYMWGFGNPNSPHTLYRSLQTNHEDFTTTPYSLNLFPGESQYIACALSFKGGMLVWKYPTGAYFVDTTDPNPVNWQQKRIGNAGAAGPANSVLLENDAIWVAPDASFHLASATYATGSVHASDIAYRKLGQFPRQQLNVSRLAYAKMVYYTQKREIHLGAAAPGSTLITRRLVLDLNREQDQGERWHFWDRDDNESLWLRRGVDSTPSLVMGDNLGQIWLLDQINRDKAGSAYTFEFFMADTDFSQFVPQWAGKWKNLRYVQVEWDPHSQASLTLEVYRDGKLSQTIVVNLTASGLVLPFGLPGVFGADTLQVSNKRRILGRARRMALRGYITQTDADVSISRMIVGVEVGE